jgi:hypothetical protein
MFLSSSGVTSAPCRSVKKSVVSKSLKKVVQSTMLTQVSRRAILDNPPWAIRQARRLRDSGVDLGSEGSVGIEASISAISSSLSMDSANS